MTPRNKGWREVRRERPGSYWWAAIGRMLVAAVVGLGWLTLGSGSRVAATDDEGAPNAEPNVETDAIIYWETNNLPPKDDPNMPGQNASNLPLEPAPAVPATPKTGQGNEEWDEWYGSGRVFPGLRYYGETNDGEGVPYADRRRRVLAVVKWVKGNAPDEVHFRLWDVDDPSDDDGPIDSDTHGPDNKDATGGHFPLEDPNHIVTVHKGKVLRFKKEGEPEEEGQADCYKVETVVGMRPGDNYRFAASANKQELIDMTQAMADKAERPDTGRISKILTVWRKLHLELDSMAKGEDNPITNKNIDAAYKDDPHPGESKAEINGFEPDDDGRYEGGTLTVTGGGGPYDIIDNWDPTWPGDDYVAVKKDITGDEDKPASFGDDDVCALPRKTDWSLVNQKFAPAYIEAVEEPGVYNPDVPFNPTVMIVDEEVVPLATPKKNRDTSADYWVSLILSCHQAKTDKDGGGIKSSVDGDPDLYYHVHLDSWKEGDQSLCWGCTVTGGQNISLVFLEACRESEAQYKQSQTELWPTIKIPRNITAKDEEQITVVHELGWVFGWLNKEGPPGTPMQPGALPSMNFNEDQIKCFRVSKEIEK
jgi:hypothetical protein